MDPQPEISLVTAFQAGPRISYPCVSGTRLDVGELVVFALQQKDMGVDWCQPHSGLNAVWAGGFYSSALPLLAQGSIESR